MYKKEDYVELISGAMISWINTEHSYALQRSDVKDRCVMLGFGIFVMREMTGVCLVEACMGAVTKGVWFGLRGCVGAWVTVCRQAVPGVWVGIVV